MLFVFWHEARVQDFTHLQQKDLEDNKSAIKILL